MSECLKPVEIHLHLLIRLHYSDGGKLEILSKDMLYPTLILLVLKHNIFFSELSVGFLIGLF